MFDKIKIFKPKNNTMITFLKNLAFLYKSHQSALILEERVIINNTILNETVYMDKNSTKMLKFPKIDSFIFIHKIFINRKPKTIFYFKSLYFLSINQLFKTENDKLNVQILETFMLPSGENNTPNNKNYETFSISNVKVFNNHLNFIDILQIYKRELFIDVYENDNKQKCLVENVYIFKEEESLLKSNMAYLSENTTSSNVIIFQFAYNNYCHNFDDMTFSMIFEDMQRIINYKKCLEDYQNLSRYLNNEKTSNLKKANSPLNKIPGIFKMIILK